MKVTTLRTLGGVTTPLILTGSVTAGFTGLSTTSKPNEYGLLVCNVYAEFDRPGEDFMQAVAGTQDNAMLIEVIGGTFYNHPEGNGRPPSTSDVAAFPSLAFDTFATIGVKQEGPNGQPYDNVVTVGFFDITGTSIYSTHTGWAITPIEPQGDPFNPEYFAGDGSVLIGQFSTADGTAISGSFVLQYLSNNVIGTQVVSFFHVPGPGGLWLLGLAGLGRRRRVRSV